MEENLENQPIENRIDLQPLREGIERVKSEVAKVLVGQDKMVELILAAILADGHILLEGVPGVAKTLASRIVAKIINADYSRVQFTPDLMPSDILGTSVFNMKSAEFEFRPGPLFSNIVLIDEINRAPAKTQSALFEVMEERQITVDGNTYTMSEPYLVMATQNPIEQEGTYRLPEAQLDRFLFKINVDYPSVEEEIKVLEFHHKQKINTSLDTISKVFTVDQINRFREMVKGVIVDQKLLNYIVKLVSDTRKDEALYLGGSPRASISIMNGAKAIAAIHGRDFITPEDIQAIALPALRHRLILSPEKEMEGISTDQVIKNTIKRIEVPR